MTKTIGAVLGLALALALSACGDDDDTGAADTADPTADATPCAELPGMATDDVMDDPQCATEAGGIELLGFAHYDCPDGTRLAWNDHGWGYTGGQWSAHTRSDGQLVPPQADLERCNA